MADRCADVGLLSTGSSDFHGPEHRLFSRFRAFSTYGREPTLGPISGDARAAVVGFVRTPATPLGWEVAA